MIHLLITGAKNRLQYIYIYEREREREKKAGLENDKGASCRETFTAVCPPPLKTNKDCLRMARTGENRGCGMISWNRSMWCEQRWGQDKGSQESEPHLSAALEGKKGRKQARKEGPIDPLTILMKWLGNMRTAVSRPNAAGSGSRHCVRLWCGSWVRRERMRERW